MSEETTNIDDKEPDLSALDNVLFKYGSSSSYSHKKQRQEEEDIPCLDVEGACEIQPPSKSFLDEIQERAKILSSQRERSAKLTLHNVVAGNHQETDDSNLDDFVKLLRAAPIGEDSLNYRSLEAESDRRYQGAQEPESLVSQSGKVTFGNFESRDERYSERSLGSDSESTVTEELDSDSDSDTDSDATDQSDFNFTWEVNADAPLGGEPLEAETADKGYFQLEALEESEPIPGSTAVGYFQLSSLDDNIAGNMAENKASIPVDTAAEDAEDQPDKEEEDQVIDLSDEEELSDKEEVVMEVEETRKSFASMDDDKAVDDFIEEASGTQRKSEPDDNVVSGDETVNTKTPSSDNVDDEDWVFLAKSEEEEDAGKDDDEAEADNEGHQDKKMKLDDAEEEEEEAKTVEMETKADEQEVLMVDEADAVLKETKDEPEVEEGTEEADGNPTPPASPEQTPEKSTTDNDDNKPDEKAASPEGVVLRQKTNSVKPQQRYSLPEFDLFDSAKTLDTEMLKSRARLGKQGALAQRRKPKRPSQDPSKRQTWMFGDPNDITQRLKGIAEDAEKDQQQKRGTRLSASEVIGLPSKDEEQISPKPKPRKPVGGVGGPMLLMGMGGPPPKLKKTGKSPLVEKKTIITPREEDEAPTKPKSEPPRLIKPKPSRPTPAAKPPKSDSAAAAPSWLKPKPDAGVSPKKPDEKPNGEILNDSSRQEETKKEVADVPAWETEKRLPPINSPRLDETPPKEVRPAKKEVKVPIWKQELLKKKKDGDAGGGKKRYSLPPPVAKKPEVSSSDAPSSPFTTMPQWQVDLTEKKIRKKKTGSLAEPSMTTTEIEIKDETTPTKIPQWKIEAAERQRKQQEEKAKIEKARDEKLKEFEKAKKEDSAPLSPIQQTTPETGNTIIPKKDNISEEDNTEEKKDKPKPSSGSPSSWKEEANVITQKKDMENKRPKPKVLGKKPVLTPKPKPAQSTSQTYNADTPQWKKDLMKKRKTSDWRNRLRSASIDQSNPPSPTSNSNEESNKLNDNNQTDENSTDTKRHTICTITVPDN